MPHHPEHSVAPIVIIGAGLAGLFAALKLAPLPVTVLSPLALGEGASSAWAQGGIAAAVAQDDSAIAHAEDTVAAGAGLVDEDIALAVAHEAAARVDDLLQFGVPFDRMPDGALSVSREAAHSHGRVVRVTGDGAGRAIMAALIDRVRNTPSIQVLEGYVAQQLEAEAGRITAIRLERIDAPDEGIRVGPLNHVILATGGLGGLYAVTTNPKSSCGRGLAMAARAGAVIEDAEFVQFHPTAIDCDLDPAPLASEALRGEGALLLDKAGQRFMPAIHPDAELAPRDVVARAVFSQVAEGKGAYLDCREAIGSDFARRFPTVYEKCQAVGLDPANQPIPVVPAEHYHMGGVRTGVDGATSVPGLWAIGEVAATGLHGANRLASNSLLEAVVFANRVAVSILEMAQTANNPRVTACTFPGAQDLQTRQTALSVIRQIMARHVGVVRDDAGLRTALQDLRTIENSADGDIEIENMAIAARFVAEAALRRKESRGAHYRSDFPLPNPNSAKSNLMTLAGLNLRDSLVAQRVLTEIANAGKSQT